MVPHVKMCGLIFSAANNDQTYVDGVSITHGYPHQHVLTFAAAQDEVTTDYSACPCTPLSQYHLKLAEAAAYKPQSSSVTALILSLTPLAIPERVIKVV